MARTARSDHRKELAELKKQRKALIGLRGRMDPSASTFIVDGQLLRLKKVIQQKEALIGSLKHQKVQRAMAKEEARIDSKNAKTGATSAAWATFVQGGSPGLKK